MSDSGTVFFLQYTGRLNYRFMENIDFEFTVLDGFKLNPNEKVVRSIVAGIRRNNGHCPCHNKYSGTDDDICPCKAYREEGDCTCTLYVKA